MIVRWGQLMANGVSAGTGPADVSTVTSIEYDFPPETAVETALMIAFGVAAIVLVWLIVRDTTRLRGVWRFWLLTLRLAAVAGLFLIALNPHRRTQKESYRPSQVAVLIDTSTSMQQPTGDAGDSSPEARQPRWEAVRKLLASSPLLAELRRTHSVDIYTFNSDLSDALHRFPRTLPPIEGAESTRSTPSADQAPNWVSLLEPTGLATRLGDSVDKLLAEVQSRTLAGIVVVSDGASNVGRDVTAPNRRARKAGVLLFAVGVGGTQPPVNLQVARFIVPTDVQLGDAFQLSALVQSQGLTRWREAAGVSAQQPLTVELLKKTGDDPQPTVVHTQDVTLAEDGVPVEVAFEQVPTAAGDIEYAVRLSPPPGLPDSRADDDGISRTVRVFDRPTRILMIAGGPMRDYRFARNALHRHKSIEVDVWLQTARVGIAQDAREILYEFPADREELFEYDVIVAFDPDWSLLPDERLALLESWVADEGGGLVIVASEVNTRQVAARPEEFPVVHKLLPVVLEEIRPQFERKDRWSQPWKVDFTQEGEAAAFLQLDDEASKSSEVWNEFPGVYRCYPTNGRKAGTTVYAYFPDPLSRGDAGPPILVASQRYSQGNVVYLGTSETWRLRALGEEYFDRLWIKLTRMAAEGRAKRGLQRAMLILDNRDYEVGQTVPLRARVLTASFEPLDRDTVTLDVVDPRGRAIVPSPVLTRDRNRASEFVGDLRVTVAGKYQLSLPIPETSETATGEINVTVPQREAAMLRQDVAQLTGLVEETGGVYLSLEEAAAKLPDLLPNRGQTFILDQQITELWDRRWVLFLMVALLSIEWLSRKLLKLA